MSVCAKTTILAGLGRTAAATGTLLSTFLLPSTALLRKQSENLHCIHAFGHVASGGAPSDALHGERCQGNLSLFTVEHHYAIPKRMHAQGLAIPDFWVRIDPGALNG